MSKTETETEQVNKFLKKQSQKSIEKRAASMLYVLSNMSENVFCKAEAECLAKYFNVKSQTDKKTFLQHQPL